MRMSAPTWTRRGPLATRLATCTVALAAASDPSMAPEPLTQDELVAVASGTRARADRAFRQLATARRSAPASARTRFEALFERRERPRPTARRARILTNPCGQDEVSSGFPPRSAAVDRTPLCVARLRRRAIAAAFRAANQAIAVDRRRRDTALVQLCGMVGLVRMDYGAAQDPVALEPWARAWESAVAAAFLNAYQAATRGTSFVPSDPAGTRATVATAHDRQGALRARIRTQQPSGLDSRSRRRTAQTDLTWLLAWALGLWFLPLPLTPLSHSLTSYAAFDSSRAAGPAWSTTRDTSAAATARHTPPMVTM